jgi:hypothetical protein
LAVLATAFFRGKERNARDSVGVRRFTNLTKPFFGALQRSGIAARQLCENVG